ncbi:MAG: DMT family transporter [Candidatus Taylorbacteria bacterium]
MAKKFLSYILISAVIFQGVFGAFGVEKSFAQGAPEKITTIKNRLHEIEMEKSALTTPDERGATRTFEESQAQLKRLSTEETNLKKQLGQLENADTKNRECFTWLRGMNIDVCIQWGLQLIGNIILQIMAIFLWLAGLLLNLTLEVTLVNMKGTLANISAINTAWMTIRDLANMFFIFALLYIAIRTILGIAGGETKKLLAHLIIAALLINFSLFFTKVIVDGSNILAYGFYKNMPGVGNFGNAAVGTTGTTVGGKKFSGMSGSIMGSLKLQSIYDATSKTPSGVGSQAANIYSSTGLFLFATLGGSVFIIITTIVFLVTAFLFVIRFVLLIILMILSPLAFVGMVLPGFSEHSKKWWDTLLGQAIFAPALMMMIWVTLKVAGGIKTAVGANADSGFAGVLWANAQASFGIVLNFAIIICMMIASLIIAKKIGEAGGHGLMQYADRFQGFLGRNAVRATGIRTLNEKFEESKFGRTPFGNALREYTTGALTETKWQGTMSAQEGYEEAKRFKAEREDIDVKNDVVGLTQSFKNADAEYEAAKLKGDDDTMAVKAKEKDEYVKLMQRKLSRIDPHDFAEVIPKHLFNDANFMRNATTGQVQAVMDGDRLETDEKEHMIAARNKHITSAFDKLEERRLQYKELEQKFSKTTTEAEGQAVLAEIAKNFKGGKAPDMSSEFPEIHKEMRAADLKDVELLYWSNPEEFMKRGLSSYRYGIIQGMRESSMVGKADSDHIRDLKPYDFVDATDSLKGIDALLINIRDADGKINHEAEKINDDLKEGLRKIYKDAYHAGEDLEKLFVGTHDVADRTGKTHTLKFNKKFQDFGEKNLTDAVSGKTYEEMRKFRNWLRNDPNIGRKLSRSHAVWIQRQDKDDVEQVVNHLLIEEWRQEQGMSKMSAENDEFLKWIRSDAKEAQSFMEGNYTYKFKLKDGTEITRGINRPPARPTPPGTAAGTTP